MNTELAIGGVPEHFNLPWLRLLESGALGGAGIRAAWSDFPGGSGVMSAALAEGRLDVAMLLCEAAVAAVAGGAPFRIVSLYTETPLLWGIHVPAGSRCAGVDDVRGARYAISRPGSGSHLMAFALARARGWPTEELAFETVGGVDGAVEALERGAADVFLWERFMTQPLVDAGLFRRIGEFAAPWPAFVVCASLSAIAEKRAALAAAVTSALSAASELAASPGAAAEISRRYGLRADEAARWLAATRWAPRILPADAAAAAAFAMLRDVGVVAAGPAPVMTAAL
ncbi:MAG TPA: PhnD/SsuA/transferrin family substrate-binding protein [Gammaproteobacteria bacterium]